MDDPELTKAVAEFTRGFKQVFHHDWLLERYRTLKTLMDDRGITPARTSGDPPDG